MASTTILTDLDACPAGSVTTVTDVFKIARYAEEHSAVFYGRLAEAFAAIPLARTLWTELAQDEMVHATELAALEGDLSVEQAAMRPGSPLAESARELRFLVSQRQVVRTLEEAYQITHELENSAITATYALLGQTFIPAEARRLLYGSRLKEHIQKLYVFSQGFGSRADRRSILIDSVYNDSW